MPKSKRYINSKVKKLYRVWENIKKVIPPAYRELTLNTSSDVVDDYPLSKGAIATHGCITLGAEFVQKFNSVESLAYMLGHELGHQVLGHVGVTYFSTACEEQDCDMFGLFICMLLKLDPHKVHKQSIEYEKWRKKYLSKNHKKSHGSGEERNKRLDAQIKYLSICSDLDIV